MTPATTFYPSAAEIAAIRTTVEATLAKLREVSQELAEWQAERREAEDQDPERFDGMG